MFDSQPGKNIEEAHLTLLGENDQHKVVQLTRVLDNKSK